MLLLWEHFSFGNIEKLNSKVKNNDHAGQTGVFSETYQARPPDESAFSIIPRLELV